MVKKVVILGSGISGLSLGWYLRKRFGSHIKVKIIEKKEHPGGWIQTERKGGFLFEKGPRSCRTRGSGIETLRLIEDLGLQEQVISPSAAAKKRFLYVNGALRPIPSGPVSLFFSSWALDVLKAFWKDMKSPQGSGKDESIHDFVSRRLGSRLSTRLFDPMTSGIYAGDIKQLSLQACYPFLANWEQEFGSVFKGFLSKKKKNPVETSPFIRQMLKESIFSFKEGMSALPNELSKCLEKDIYYKCFAKRLQVDENGAQLELNDGTLIKADYIYSSLPASETALLLENLPLSKTLGSISSASVAVVNVGYQGKVLKKEGFGYLIPSQEKEAILGVVWDSSIFPKQQNSPNETRLTVMIGGEHMADFSSKSSSDFLKIAQESLLKHLDIHQSPDVYSIQIANRAIPQYKVGHLETVRQIEKDLQHHFPRLTLLGSSYRGVSINDCIAYSHKLANSFCL